LLRQQATRPTRLPKRPQEQPVTLQAQGKITAIYAVAPKTHSRSSLTLLRSPCRLRGSGGRHR
jgi:hypothetical protein